MKILAISASHRNGNTDAAINFLGKHLVLKEHSFKLIDLKKKNLKFSTGDSDEYYTGKPAVLDAMQEIQKEILKSNLLILATPNYFSNVSALMKNFMDRTNPYYCNHDFKSKKTALLVVSASKGSSPKMCLACLKEFCRIHKMNVIQSKIFIAEHSDDFKKSKKLRKEIEQFAEKFLAEK
ncbi:MAG: NAD(P)H-dependent oxidoreductase [archaeon]